MTGELSQELAVLLTRHGVHHMCLALERVVCSIRFSPDGNILATGSNHATRLYNVSTGEQI